MTKWGHDLLLRKFLLFLLPLLCAALQTRIVHRSSIRFTQKHPQVCYLNRFLFDPEEIDRDDESDVPVVTLPKDDYRTVHAAKILGLQNGDTIRAGLVSCQNNNDNDNQQNGGFLTDTATIEWVPEGKVKKAEPLGNGKPPGSIRISLHHLIPPPPCQVPTVALLLALPRPLALGRMLPMIAQMGVSHLVLTQASKVPKDYFGSHLFRKPEALRERLIEGLCQAGDVRLPEVLVVKNLKHFLQDDLEELFPSDAYARVIAHPQRKTDDATALKRMRDVAFASASSNDQSTSASPSSSRILLAVGPEGGWEEPGELGRFQQHNFQQITLGSRVLRSDCAVVSLLALAHDACSD